MKTTFTHAKLVLVVLFGILGIPATWGEVALAQSVDTPSVDTPTLPANVPDKDLSPSNEVNSNNPLGNGLNLNDIMHNVNLSRSRNSSEFADDTQRKLKKAADEFKQMQLQQLQQQPTAPTAPTGAPGQ
jgi:hypothetical protein